MVLFGFAVGLLVGLTGTGGGSVMTPLLVVVFGINPATAIGTDIAYSAVEKSVGGFRQWRAGNVICRCPRGWRSARFLARSRV
jgi:uncharacterized membrane protein YfcA